MPFPALELGIENIQPGERPGAAPNHNHQPSQEVKDMSEEIKEKLGEAGEAFANLPPFIQGKICGYAEAVQAMSRDQPAEQEKAE
jgi:hypothetical protein